MIPYAYYGPDKATRDNLALRLKAKGAKVTMTDGKRLVKHAKLLREDKDDPDKVTSIVPEGEETLDDVFILESDKLP